MSFFADKNPRYLLPILPAAAIVTATTVMQHVRATTWTATNQILNLFHWLVLAGIAVLLPLAASGPVIELHRVDDSPWYSVPFAVSAAAGAAAMIAAGLLLQRRSRCALVAATFVIMLYSQWIFMAGYSRTEAAVAQYRPLMQAVLSAAPDAEIYNAHPPGKRPPTDLGVYANREIVWIADPSKLTPGEHPRVLLVPQDKGTPDPTPLSGWTTLYKQQRGGDRWWAFRLPAKS